MTTPIVPIDHEAADVHAESTARERRWRRLRRTLVVLVPVAVIVAASFLIQLPYYLIQPGSVRPAAERIEVTGGRVYDDTGELLFTTVRMTRATPALLVQAALDDAIEVRHRDEIYPQGDVDGTRRQNFRRMDLSKLHATRVALDYLGVDAELDADGAHVLGLVDDSPSAGLIEPGDVIVSVDGGEVSMPADIATELEDRAPGDQVEVRVERRDGEAEEPVLVVLGTLSDDDHDEGVRPALGVEVEPSNPRVVSSVTVAVDSGEVSGPSAGLAWTLGIIDRLTPGPLAGGGRVAVTGEIFPDGTVGPVGGVVQKVAAVRRAGIETFLYPAATPEAEQREMRRVAGEAVTLHPVASVADAVELLAPEGLRRPG